MADLIETKATFPKSGGLAVAGGAVSVNAGNGLRVNPSTGMVEVPVDTTAGLGYGSNGLEVEVDGSTIDFNSTGQLTALGGGVAPFTIVDVGKPGVGSKIGRWTLYNPAYNDGLRRTVAGFVGEDWIYLIGTTLDKDTGNISASALVNVSYDEPPGIPYVNGMIVSSYPVKLECVPVSYTASSSEAKNTLLKATYSTSQGLLMLSTYSSPPNFAPDNTINFYCKLNILITFE